MDDEPPAEFVAFVAGRLASLRSETARLVGGERFAPEVYTEVLTDLAGHWRRLCWRSRLSHRDAHAEYLDRRLTARTRQWREEQIYPVEVSVAGHDPWPAPATPPTPAALYRRPAPVAQTVAHRLAPLLPTTARAEAQVLAEAGIAWVHAYRRYVWRRYARMCGGIVLLIGYLVQFMSQFSTPS
ncbi:hypothetical protein ACFQFC_34100 [Amorphoplanes digitatis]|uniref:Uncharacterized protein n=1 Tax=Actinoplanes digitatis TaxID=1868 RepID=A0A7W7MNN7_9ACTN|nr:hypothetical protein [Actinoplanes digitatis]MBB4761196.1 hypothetical protein [Actinoplanes digitatis]